jgi:hypothetical protein
MVRIIICLCCPLHYSLSVQICITQHQPMGVWPRLVTFRVTRSFQVLWNVTSYLMTHVYWFFKHWQFLRLQNPAVIAGAKVRRFFEVSVNVHQSTRYNIAEELNFQGRRCERPSRPTKYKHFAGTRPLHLLGVKSVKRQSRILRNFSI